MIAVDTNILVYAHRTDSTWHRYADICLTELAESGKAWAIPWPCLHEFFAIVTHAKIYQPATPMEDALTQIDCWLAAPTLNLLSETDEYYSIMKEMVRDSKCHGAKIQDARIMALCKLHHVKTLWSADRDFNRFAGVKIVNPLIK